MLKKIAYGFLALVVVLLVGIYVVAFTDFGNGIVKNKANQIIKEKTGLNAEITRFYLRFSRLEVDANLDNAVFASLQSDLSLFSLGFDGTLNIKADDLTKISPMLDTKILIDGDFKGKASDFITNINGVLFDKKLHIDTHLIDYNPSIINANLEPLEISNFFALLKQPKYATGLLSFNANAKDLKQINFNLKVENITPSEDALKLALGKDLKALKQIKVSQNDFITNFNANFATKDLNKDAIEGKISLADINKNYNINLTPKNVKLQNITSGNDINAKLDINILKWNLINKLFAQKIPNGKNDGIFADIKVDKNYKQIDISTKIANFFINETSQNITFSHNLASNQSEVNIPKLELWHLKSFGFDENVNIKASAKLDNFNPSLANATISTLGANIIASLKQKNLSVNAKDVDISRALKAVSQPNYASGKANFDMKLNDYTALIGNIDLSAKTTLNNSLIKKDFGINTAGNNTVDFSANAKLNKDIITFTSNLSSAFANLNTTNGSYNLKTGKMTTSYSAKNVDYANIGALVDRKLRGSSDFAGNITFDKKLIATINSQNLLNGSLDASLNGDKLKANLKNIDATKLAYTLCMPELYLGKANGNVDFDIAKNSGSFNFAFGEGRLKQTKLLTAIDKLVNAKLANEVIQNVNLNGTMAKEIVKFNFDTNSARFKLVSKGATANTKTESLNVPLSLFLNGNEWKSTIKGSFAEPKFALDMDDLKQKAKEKAKEEIKKEVDKHKDELKEKANKELKKGLNKLFKL